MPRPVRDAGALPVSAAIRSHRGAPPRSWPVSHFLSRGWRCRHHSACPARCAGLRSHPVPVLADQGPTLFRLATSTDIHMAVHCIALGQGPAFSRTEASCFFSSTGRSRKLRTMSRYTIHKSGSVSSGLGSRPLSETARVRKYGRLHGMEEPGLIDRIRLMLGRRSIRGR